jgi:hypothetical protein
LAADGCAEERGGARDHSNLARELVGFHETLNVVPSLSKPVTASPLPAENR